MDWRLSVSGSTQSSLEESSRNNRFICLGLVGPRVVAPILAYPWYAADEGAYLGLDDPYGIRSGYFCSTP